MTPSAEYEAVWHDIGMVLNALPPETRHRYRAALRYCIHDLGHHLGLITTSVGLLRREQQRNPQEAVDEELLNIIEDAAQALTVLLAQIRQLPDTIDDDAASA